MPAQFSPSFQRLFVFIVQQLFINCNRKDTVTHVTGIACGNGLRSGGLYAGLAPEAGIVSVKILDSHGKGNTAAAVLGLRWIMDNAGKYTIKAVNLSIGTGGRRTDRALKEAADLLWKRGIVVVTAAGNPDGRNPPPPAISSAVLSVGAWEDRAFFQRPAFSLFSKEHHTLPDLWAEGEDIISVCSPDFSFSLPGRSREKMAGTSYVRMSGASMATPFVTGAAALLLERFPHADPAEIREKLLSAASLQNGLLNRQNLLTLF